MPVSTQRLKINQTWQQVATGSATLQGCYAGAEYHVYVGEQPPTIESAYISDNLLTPTTYNHNAPVYLKLNATNTLSEAGVIVMGQAVASTLPPAPNPSLFKTLQNMTYDDKTYEFTLGEGAHFAELNAGFNEFKFKIPKDTQVFSLKIGNMPVNVPPMGFVGLSVDLVKTPDSYNFTYDEDGTPPQYVLNNAPFDFNTVFTIHVEPDGKVQISTDNGKYFDGSALYKMKEGDITSLSVMMQRPQN